MRKNTVLQRIPSTRRDIRTWPSVDAYALPEEKREDFLRNRKAITALLAQASYREITKETGVSSAKVRRLLAKCLQPDGNGDICGERGLLPFIHVQPYIRRTRVARMEGAGRGGCSGALTQLFDEFPELEERIEQEILKRLPAGVKVAEAKISIVDLHRVFLQLCEKVGRNADQQWPFNTKTKGRTSLINYVKRVGQKKPHQFIRARYGKDAGTRLHVGSGHSSLLSPQLPYDIVGIDEFTFDLITTVAIPILGGGVRDVAIERIHVVVVIELVSKAICSWYAFFTNSVTSRDIRHAIQNALNPWKPKEFSISGLTYGHPDAGLPSGLIPSLAYHPWTVLVVDNALAHQDIGLLSDLGEVIGSFINLGPVGAWYRRADVERKILEVLRSSAQRLPSTTGSSPVDARKNDPVQTAVKLRIRWSEVLQLIEVVIAQQNAIPSEGIGMLTPIELLRQLVTDPCQHFLLRTLPSERHVSNCLSVVYEEVVVRGSQRVGRRPYINLDRARYTNPILAKSWHLIGQKLRIAIDEDDFRSVEASVMDSGIKLGMLIAQGPWSRTPHTREMRRAINRLKHLRTLAIPPHADPVAAYLAHLAAKAATEGGAETKHKRVSKAGTRLAEIDHRTGVTAASLSKPNAERPDLPSLALPSEVARSELRDLLWQSELDGGGEQDELHR